MYSPIYGFFTWGWLLILLLLSTKWVWAIWSSVWVYLEAKSYNLKLNGGSWIILLVLIEPVCYKWIFAIFLGSLLIMLGIYEVTYDHLILIYCWFKIQQETVLLISAAVALAYLFSLHFQYSLCYCLFKSIMSPTLFKPYEKGKGGCYWTWGP